MEIKLVFFEGGIGYPCYSEVLHPHHTYMQMTLNELISRIHTHIYIIYIFSENKVGRASEVRDQKGVEGGSKGWVRAK